VVDTHFARLVRRFGWTAQTHPDKIERDVAALLPPQEAELSSTGTTGVGHGFFYYHTPMYRPVADPGS